MNDIKELREKVAAKRAELKELFDAKEGGKYTSEQKGEIQTRNDELAGLAQILLERLPKAKQGFHLVDFEEGQVQLPPTMMMMTLH